MNIRSILTIGIILVGLSSVINDTFTLLSFLDIILRNDDEPALGLVADNISPYLFFILFIFKILLIVKAGTVSSYLLKSVKEDTQVAIRMEDVLLVVGIVLCIQDLPELIAAIVRYKANSYFTEGDAYKSFYDKTPLYYTGIRLLLSFALIYFRKDLVEKVRNKQD